MALILEINLVQTEIYSSASSKQEVPLTCNGLWLQNNTVKHEYYEHA